MGSPIESARVGQHLVGLASLEVAIGFAIRAAVQSYPALNKVQCPNEPSEIATARDFVDQCERLLAALNAHWNVLVTGRPIHDDYDDYDIPF